MEPDLKALAARGLLLLDELEEYGARILEAYDEALGELDVETDREITPGNGDDPGLYEQAGAKTREAREALASVVELLATQEGYRHFDELRASR
jgi:hypothetical protein